MADSFTIGAGETVFTQQELDSDNDVGLIEQGGQLNTGADIAVTSLVAADGVTVINRGGIDTTGASAAGISIFSPNATITNSGTITTQGTSSEGIVAGGDNANVTNSGTISTSGHNAFGIGSNGDNATITNSGLITTTGTGADGIHARRNNTVITNSGTIRVSGSLNAAAIDLDSGGSDSHTLTNTGSLIATGDATVAIVGGSGVQTVTLGTGSRVIGSIDLGGGDDVLTVVQGRDVSATLTIENTETIVLTGEAVFESGNRVIAVDPTGQSFLGAAVSALAGSAHGAINRRALRPPGDASGTATGRAPLQLASLESDTRPRASAGLQTAQRPESAGSSGAAGDGPAAWGEAFGALGSRGNDGQTLAYDHDYIGAMGGYETRIDAFQLGVAAGFAQGSIDTDESSINTDVDSYFVGLYGEREFGRFRFSGSVIGGYEEYENDRLVVDNLNGFETAQADFDNLFISPSVTLGAGLPMAEDFELRPSGTATYTAAFFDSYSEEGTTASNLSIDSRTAQVLNTRLQLAVAMLPAGAEIELRGGLEGRFSDQDDVDGDLAGTNFSFATTEDDSVYGGYVGMNVQVFTADRLSVAGDLEYRTAGGDEDALSGALRATYRF